MCSIEWRHTDIADIFITVLGTPHRAQ